MTSLRWGSATDTGLVRQNNQDHLLTEDHLFAVADGMGGHAAGEVASMVAVGALRDEFNAVDHATRTADDLVDAVRHANSAVYEQALGDINLRGMGTTITAAALVVIDGEERIAIANVGDSRAYVFTQNELTQLTEDHSVAEELVRQGQLDPAEVETHPQRHILTRAMGIMPEVDVDLWEILPLAGDRILLCSDGLVREVSDDQIAAVLRRLADPTEAAQDLVARARAGGGSDNITVVVVDVVDDGGLALAASAAVMNAKAADAGTHGHEGIKIETEPGAEGVHPKIREEGAGATLSTSLVPKRKRVTLRVVLFILLIGALLGGAGVAVVNYARGSYYATLGPAGTAPPSALAGPTDQPIVIYRGRPGGLLWFAPTLEERTPYTTAEVCPVALPDLAKGKVFADIAATERYVKSLVQEAAQTCPGGATGGGAETPGTTLPATTLAR